MVAMTENYTFLEEVKINLDKRGIKTSYKKFLFPLHFGDRVISENIFPADSFAPRGLAL
jgi:hypothetical protein